mmetsp:Transcript_32068/g.81682  ORF Transcript_32068/g.81682 Transcript_32068/m.81682 type:complete len:265 (+) Transcript_32068:361-1155(+)
MGRGRLGEEKAHRVTLVAERRLHADEDVAEALPVDQKVLTVRVELTRGGAPVLDKLFRIGAHLAVLVDRHAVLYIEVGGAYASLLVVEDRIHETIGRIGEVAEVVALALQLLADGVDRPEDVEVGGGANVALVGRKGEDRDGQAFVFVGLDAQVGPLEGAVRDKIDAVGKGHGAARHTVTPAIDDRLNGAVDLWERDLQSDLDGVQAKFRALPLLERLKHEGDGANIGPVEGSECLHGLVMVLRGGPANKGKAREVDDGVRDNA